ncbi:type II secretion system protein E [gamma proteobacterium HTCC5015]|nr:type II secretion system protein E [gamma proteobacterium HTCC5015]
MSESVEAVSVGCAAGLLSEDQAQVVRQEVGFGLADQLDAIESLGFANRDAIKQSVARSLACECASEDALNPCARALACVPASVANRYRVMPMALQDGGLWLAVTDPQDVLMRDALLQQLRPLQIVPRWQLALPSEIEQWQQRFYADRRKEAVVSLLADQYRQRDRWAQELADAVLIEAVQAGASDIHLEPERDYARLRLRVDGVMRVLSVLRRSQWEPLLGRFKVLCDLDMGEQRAAQDGKLQRRIDGRDIDVRASVLPSLHGEVLVLRLLNRSARYLSLNELGVSSPQCQQLQALVQKPQGMTLVCGPTGSGKTTTLYALLALLDHRQNTIATLEDPVEYPFDGIRQTDLSRGAKLGFADGVRALLRQDPDVLLIGEIRDTETAKMAFRAAMTGHRVLTTVHAASARGALRRLVELGVGTAALAEQLNGIIAQRLVRRRCDACGHREDRQCPSCGGLGYRGRQALMDILILDEPLQKALQEGGVLDGFAADGLLEVALEALREQRIDRAEFERVFGRLPRESLAERSVANRAGAEA